MQLLDRNLTTKSKKIIGFDIFKNPLPRNNVTNNICS